MTRVQRFDDTPVHRILRQRARCDWIIEGFSHFVTSMTAPVRFRLERFAGWGLHPLESAALSRRTPILDIGRVAARLSVHGLVNAPLL